MVLQFALDIPNNVQLFNVDDFKRKLLEYADSLVKAMAPQAPKPQKANYKMKPLSELDPVLQELCGICTISEEDINGDKARELELEKI